MKWDQFNVDVNNKLKKNLLDNEFVRYQTLQVLGSGSSGEKNQGCRI